MSSMVVELVLLERVVEQIVPMVMVRIRTVHTMRIRGRIGM